MKKNNKYEQKRKILRIQTIKVGGALHHLFREDKNKKWLHHNTDGPAIEPINSEDRSVSKKYYIFGFEKTKEEFREYQQSKEGLPWYKNPSMKAVARF